MITNNRTYNFIEIDGLEIPELEVYRQRNEVKLLRINEPDPGIFVCESAKVIRRAIEAGYEPISILTSVNNPDEDARFVYESSDKVPIYYGDDKVLRELAGYALTGGVLAVMRRKTLPPIEEIVEGRKLVAVLENVQNPTNVGAIFRSAAAMGIESVILTYDCSDPLYRRAERVSMGTVFQIPWTKTDRKTDYLAVLSANGFSTVSMALRDDAVRIDDLTIKECERLAVILGNEGYGLSADTIKRSDHVAMIPMNPAVDSLNVGAASAVMFWELMRDRI